MRKLITAFGFVLISCGPNPGPPNNTTCTGADPIYENCEGKMGMTDVPQLHLSIQDANLDILQHVAEAVDADLMKLGCTSLGHGDYSCSFAPPCKH